MSATPVPATVTIDSTLIIALISLSTSLITTFGALLVKNYVDSKKTDRIRLTKQLNYINTNVYSPLLFNLFEASDNLSFISGSLSGFLETKEYSVDVNRQLIITTLKERCDMQCTQIKDILLDKIALIQPHRFREQLFFFFQFLKMFEVYVKEFTNEGFSKNYEEQSLKFLENLQFASLELSKKAAVFMAFIELLVEQEGKVLSTPEMFTKEEMKKLQNLIISRNVLISQEAMARGLFGEKVKT